jgi:multisubunit Na+/H+ antiporter MnhE subunit
MKNYVIYRILLIIFFLIITSFDVIFLDGGLFSLICGIIVSFTVPFALIRSNGKRDDLKKK